jgi:D-lactate dehydrogenase
MKVTFFSAKPYDIEYLNKANNGKLELHFVEESLSANSVLLAKGSKAVSVFTNDDVSENIIEKLKTLGVESVATRSAGFDHINISKAEELEVTVANVPQYSPYSIAEHAVSMMLCLNRKLIKADRKVKNHNYLLDDLIGFDLHNKTVGIIGTGKIGGIVAKILQGFGCRILAFDVSPNQEYVHTFGIRYVDLDQLYAESDIITIHCPLNKNTKHLIDKNSINKMKKGVMIINTARGGVIETEALIQGLKEGKIGFAGLDVYEREKGLFFFNQENEILQDDVFARLLTFQNVLITGHQAFLTHEALKNIADTTIHNLECVELKIRSGNELTKEPIVLI